MTINPRWRFPSAGGLGLGGGGVPPVGGPPGAAGGLRSAKSGWPFFAGQPKDADIRERVARLQQRLEAQAAQRRSSQEPMQLPDDFESMDPAAIQQYLLQQRRGRMQRMEDQADDEIWGIAKLYLGVAAVFISLALLSAITGT